MSEVVLIEFVGDSKSGVAAAQEQVAANKEVAASAREVGAASKASAATASKSLAASGAAMSRTGKSMTKYVSLPLLAIGAAATKMSLDFSKAMLLIETHTDTSRKQVELYRKTILEMSSSGKFTQGPKELAEAMYHIASDGYKGAKALDVLKESAHLATLGQSNLAETTYALVSAEKTSIKGTEDLHKAIGTLNGIVGAGDMKMQDLVGAMSTGVLPAAKSVGLSLTDVGAALDVMTQRGVPAQQAAYRLAMNFAMLSPYTDKAKKAFKELGLGQYQLVKEVKGPTGLLDALKVLQEHLDGLNKFEQRTKIQEIFGGGRSSRAMLTLLQNLKGLEQAYGSINHLSGETNKNLETALKSPVNEWAKQWAKLQAALVEVGNELVPVVIPAMKDVAGALTDLASGFEALPKGTQEWAIKLGVLGIALGPVLRMMGGLTTGLSKVIKLSTRAAAATGLIETTAAAGGASAAEGIAAKELLMARSVGVGLTAPAAAGAGDGIAAAGAAAAASQPEILAAVAAVAALSAGLVILYKNSKTFREEVGELGSAVSHAANEIGAQIQPLIHSFQHLAHAFSTLPIVKQIEALHLPLSRFSDFFHSTFVEVIRSGFKVIAQKIQGLGKIFAGSVEVISGLVNLLSDLLEGKLGKAWHAVEGIFKGGAHIVVGAVQAMSAPIRAAIELQGDIMHKLFGGIWTDVEGIFTSGINAVIGFINDLISAINVIPGVPDIGKIGEISSGGGPHWKQHGEAKLHHQHRARGGPIFEGAPSGDTVPAMLERGEYVLNKKAVAKVGKGTLDRINFQEAPRFAFGGSIGEAIGGAASSVAELPSKAVGTLAGALSILPTPHLPGWLSGLGSYIIDEVTSYITSGFREQKFGTIKHGRGSSFGPKGVGSYMGIPMANWVIESLQFAARKGVAPQPTSGYRPGFDPHTATGQSEHAGTQYPHGAVDFGGYTDPTALREKMAVVHATSNFKYPLLAPIGFHDDGHASGTGHQLGGLIGLARGGHVKLHGPPLFRGEGPSWYGKALVHNKPWATHNAPWQTALSSHEEDLFRRWIKKHNVPFDPSAQRVDYDMRGYWRATGGKWEGGHFPDTWKTPYDTTFSNESRYAKRGTPFVWTKNWKWLYDRRNGQIISSGRFAQGGLVDLVQRLASGGSVVKTAGEVMLRNALDSVSAAGILGNAFGESSWNPASIGSGGGGLWGFTAHPNSLSDLQAYAAHQGKPWTDVTTQTQFMLHHLAGSIKAKLNAASSTDDTTSIFMHEWERPLNYDSLPTRQDAAAKALKMLGGASATKPKIPKQLHGHYVTHHAGDTSKGGGTYAETAHGTYKVQTSPLSFGSVPGSIAGCRRELRQRQQELSEYKAAARQAKSSSTRRALEANVKKIQQRIRELVRTIGELIKKRKRERQTHKIEGHGLFPKIEEAIANRKRGYDEASEYAEQVVALEPEENAAGYITGREGPAWQKVLNQESQWRNAILTGEIVAAKRLGSLESQLQKVEGLRGSPAFSKQRWRIAPLKTAIASIKSVWSKNQHGVSGSFEEGLEGLQGPGKSHALMDALPTEPVAGSFGGLIFDTQMTIRELGLKLKQSNEGAEGNTGLLEAERALKEQALRGQRLAELQYGPLTEFLKHMPPYIGAFKTGGQIPGGVNQAYTATVHGGETIVPAGGGSTYFNLHLHGDMASAVESAMPGMVKEIDRRQGQTYRRITYGPGAKR